jgi:hypothetical protein
LVGIASIGFFMRRAYFLREVTHEERNFRALFITRKVVEKSVICGPQETELVHLAARGAQTEPRSFLDRQKGHRSKHGIPPLRSCLGSGVRLVRWRNQFNYSNNVSGEPPEFDEQRPPTDWLAGTDTSVMNTSTSIRLVYPPLAVSTILALQLVFCLEPSTTTKNGPESIEHSL